MIPWLGGGQVLDELANSTGVLTVVENGLRRLEKCRATGLLQVAMAQLFFGLKPIHGV